VALTQVSYWTARGWIECGKLPAVRLPGRLIHIKPSVLEWILVETECRPVKLRGRGMARLYRRRFMLDGSWTCSSPACSERHGAPARPKT